MWRLVETMKRGLRIGRYKKSARVADESAFGSLVLDQHQEINRSVNRFTTLLAIVRAPIAVASCLVGSPTGMEDVWVSGERPRSSEMDHLMVRDSMRYALYV